MLVSLRCRDRSPQTWWLNLFSWPEIYSLTILEARSLKWKYGQGCSPPEVLGENLVHASLLDSSGILWLVAALQSCLLSSHHPSSVPLWFIPPFSHRHQSLDVGLPLNPGRFHLETFTYTCNEPLSKEGYVLRLLGRKDFGDTVQPTTTPYTFVLDTEACKQLAFFFHAIFS